MKKVLVISFLFSMIATTVVAQTEPTADKIRTDRARGIVLPKSNDMYRVTKDYVEDEPDADYLHASEAAYEAFRDIKFSVMIHWGIYSMQGIEASWPLLVMNSADKQNYQRLYERFNPEKFDAEEWMTMFKRCGVQAFSFTAKHHDGFSMFHTDTRVRKRVNYVHPDRLIESCDMAYSIEETPFKRDVVKELCDAAGRNNIKVSLYYSHTDWNDADFRPYCFHPLTTNAARTTTEFGIGSYDANRILAPDVNDNERDRMIARHREQLREILTRYGTIDMIHLDMWLGSNVWTEMKKTVKMIRQLQPEVMLNAGGIGNYADFFIHDNFVPKTKEPTSMPWISMLPLGKTFAYDPDSSRYKGAKWIIDNLVNCVAKGGGFMVGISPDARGEFHPEAVRQLEDVGKWLAINGEGIYGTTSREVWKSGDILFTQSKDGKQIYAFVNNFTAKTLIISSVKPVKGSRITILGYDKPLKWKQAADGCIIIKIPRAIKSPAKRPCEYLWTLKFDTNDEL
jgi:alpha-L-fucosidase